MSLRGRSLERRLLLAALIMFSLAAAVYWSPGEGTKATAKVEPQKRRGTAELHEGIVARVDGLVISSAEVLPLVGPRRPWIGTAEPTDPRVAALKEIIRSRLFAAEALERGLSSNHSDPVIARGELAQGLIATVLADAGLSLESISRDDARRFYTRNVGLFHEVESVDLSVVKTSRATVARQMLYRSANTGRTLEQVSREAEFADADVRPERVSVDAHATDEIPDSLARTAMWMRREGEVGLARFHGAYYVLRANDIRLDATRWTRPLALRVKNYLLAEQREKVLESLEGELRTQADIEINHEALAQMPIPTWAEFSASQ